MNFTPPEMKGGIGGYSISSSRGAPSSAASTVARLQLSGGKVPDINGVEMPDWLDTDPDAEIGELLQTYAGIGAAFDPKAQVKARENAAAYNTSAGNQAANNAATEYANRAAQSGGSALCAGVVKAQALMPVMRENAALKTDAADVAAKSHQQAISLAAQVASTIGSLRNSYLASLTGYATDQQKLGLAATQFDADLNQKERGLDLERDKLSLQESSEKRLAASTMLAQRRPDGSFEVNNAGDVTSGRSDYDVFKNWQNQQSRAMSALGSYY
jgi:hypothetical protein